MASAFSSSQLAPLRWKPSKDLKDGGRVSFLTAVFGGSDEPLLWAAGNPSVELMKAVIPAGASVQTLAFPPSWIQKILEPQGWAWCRLEAPGKGVNAWIPRPGKMVLPREGETWIPLAHPFSWRFLRLFFPGYRKAGDEVWRSVPLEVAGSWQGPGKGQWMGTRGAALGVEGSGAVQEGFLNSLVKTAEGQLTSTGWWAGNQIWQPVNPTYRAQGTTFRFRILAGGEVRTAYLFLTYGFLADAARRLVPPEIHSLNSGKVFSALDMALLIKESLADPQVLMEERIRMPLTLTFGEALGWLGPGDRSKFLQTLVLGKKTSRGLKGLTHFYHGNRIWPDPGLQEIHLRRELTDLRWQDWKAAQLPEAWGIKSFQEANQEILSQCASAVRRDPRVLSAHGNKILAQLWTKVEETRLRGLLGRFARELPFEGGFSRLNRPQAQRTALAFRDGEWARLFWAASDLAPLVRSWFSRRRWRRLLEDLAAVKKLDSQGLLDLAGVWSLCRRWTLRNQALIRGGKQDRISG